MPLVLPGSVVADDEISDARRRARKIRPEMTHGQLVRVASSRHQAEAELIENILLEEGIPSVLRRAPGFDVPDFLAAGPRDVLVPESAAELARITLADARMDTQLAAPAHLQRPHVVRLALAVTGGAGLAALVAWGLVQLVH